MPRIDVAPPAPSSARSGLKVLNVWTNRPGRHKPRLYLRCMELGREPRLERLEVAWWFHAPSGRTTCGFYQTDVGIEVRVGYSAEDLFYSRRTSSMETRTTSGRRA